jgi:hypothetical protein
MSALDPRLLKGDLMEIVIATLIAVPLVTLVIGAPSGRIRLTSCCATSDPSRDLRMRTAFESDQRPAD